jgi:uncharacterized protein (TIGR02596 family)
MTKLLKDKWRPARRSFSLLEMLLVLALLAVLIVLAIEGYNGVVQAAAVTTGADMLSDAFTEARASAVAQNTPVEVRIYDLPPQPNATPAYDALQLHWLKANGTTPPVNTTLFLSSWIAIDATPAHSPLIAANNQAPTPDASDSRLNGQTRVFHFLPDGSTDLNPATNWFLTVRAATQSNPAHFPANWACVQIDATTGRAQIYRP